jgi:hypothetical protein
VRVFDLRILLVLDTYSSAHWQPAGTVPDISKACKQHVVQANPQASTSHQYMASGCQRLTLSGCNAVAVAAREVPALTRHPPEA